MIRKDKDTKVMLMVQSVPPIVKQYKWVFDLE